jgi:8-oxo-dGTP diphosphatase
MQMSPSSGSRHSSGIYHESRRSFNMLAARTDHAWIMMLSSLALNALLLLLFLQKQYSSVWSPSMVVSKDMVYHGGHPLAAKSGTCWCAPDKYCMCTPSVAIDLVLMASPDQVWLVRRKDTSQLATMGGFVELGETVEAAVRRELMEELGIDLVQPPKLFGVYSDPRRDNRRHTLSVVFAVSLPDGAKPKAADDVKDVMKIRLSDIDKYEYFADHKTILMDYVRAVERRPASREGDGDFANDIVRSMCLDHVGGGV